MMSLQIRAAQLDVCWSGLHAVLISFWKTVPEYQRKCLACLPARTVPPPESCYFFRLREHLQPHVVLNLNQFHFKHCYLWSSLAWMKLGTAEKTFK